MEPYKDAHRPWEPNSTEQVLSYITIQSARTDLILYQSLYNLINRGFRGPDFTFAIIGMCQSADAIIYNVMRNAQDV